MMKHGWRPGRVDEVHSIDYSSDYVYILNTHVRHLDVSCWRRNLDPQGVLRVLFKPAMQQQEHLSTAIRILKSCAWPIYAPFFTFLTDSSHHGIGLQSWQCDHTNERRAICSMSSKIFKSCSFSPFCSAKKANSSLDHGRAGRETAPVSMELPPLPPKSTTREQLVPSFRGATTDRNDLVFSLPTEGQNPTPFDALPGLPGTPGFPGPTVTVTGYLSLVVLGP